MEDLVEEVKVEDMDVKVPAGKPIRVPLLTEDRLKEIQRMLAQWENRKKDTP